MTNARFSYRLLAMILAFLMVLTSVPVVAFADEGKTTVQGNESTGTTNPSGSQNGATTPENGASKEPGNKSELEALLVAGGLVTLDRDYVLDQTIVITNDVEIELNGHTISYTSTGDVGGYYVFEIGVWDEENAENRKAPVVSIRDSSEARTGKLVSDYTGVLSLVHGKLNVESGYYKAAPAQPVLRLNSHSPNAGDLLTVYGGRFDGQMPQTFDGRFVIHGGMFDSPNVANLIINSIFKVRSFNEIDGREYYVVSVGINDQDEDEILGWYLDELEENANEVYDLVIENIEEYMWFARLVAEGEFEYTDAAGQVLTICANDDIVILAADITFGVEYNDVTYDIYAPIGSERAPFEGAFFGNKNYADVTLPVAVPTISVPQIINAINAGIFGYVTGDAVIASLTVSVNEIKNVANIMGENNITKLYTSSGVLAGTVAGNVNVFNVEAASDKYALIGVVAAGAVLTMSGPVHALDAQGNEIAPEHGFIDTAELYIEKLGAVVINGGFYSFELDAEDIPAHLVRTREAINKAKTYNVDDPNWYSVTDKDDFVALLNNELVGEYGYFETLQAAIDAADADHVLIEVLADIVDEDVVIATDDKLIINYYGYTHSGIITVDGTLELRARDGRFASVVNNGMLTVDVNDAWIEKLDNKAALTVKSGRVAELLKSEDATAVIEGGYFKNIAKAKVGYIITGGYFTNAAKPLPEMADGKNGFAVVINTNVENNVDYPWTVKNEGNEALVKFGDFTLAFEFIEEALDYIQTNKVQDAVVTMLQDVTLENLYKTYVDVAYTLDLGGYTLTADDIGFVFAAGHVTIKNGAIRAKNTALWVDTMGTGANVSLTLEEDLKVVSVEGKGLCANIKSGKLILDVAADITAKDVAIGINGTADACKLNVTGATIISTGAEAISIQNDAIVTIDGATIDAYTTAIITSAATTLNIAQTDVASEIGDGIVLLGDTTITMDTVTVNADGFGVYVGAKAVVTMNNTTITAKDNALCIEKVADVTIGNSALVSTADTAVMIGVDATVEITDTKIEAAKAGVYVAAGTVTISGETVVTGTEHAVLVDYTGEDVSVTINGGTYNSNGNAFEFVNDRRSIPGVNLEINDGIFNAPVVSNGVYGFVKGGYFVAIDRNLVAAGLARSDAPNFEINGKMYYSILTDVEAFILDSVSGNFIGYQFLETAIAEVAHGGVVYLGMNITDKDANGEFIVVPDPTDSTKTIVRQAKGGAEFTSYAIQLTKCVTITSYDPNNTGVKFSLENVSFDLYTYKNVPAEHTNGDAETNYVFTNLQFVGNSHIHYHKQQGASTLKIDNVNANVTGGAFLFAWDAMGVVADDYELLLTLVLTNNTIIATDINNQYNFAVEVEATLCDGSLIANNVFGSEDAPFTETYVFKAFKIQGIDQNAGVRATIRVEYNTVYMKNEVRPASAFEFAGENEFLMLGKANTIVSLNTEVEGSLPYRIAMYSVGQNGIIVDLVDGTKQSNINGTPLTLQNVYYQPGQAPKYVGILIDLVEESYYDEDLGITVTEKLIVGGIFDVYADEINEKVARHAYLKYTEFENGYKNMTGYVGYVVTKLLGDGSIDNPYVIPDDETMTKVLYDGVQDGAYYLVGIGVDVALIGEFVIDLNDGYDSYIAEAGIDDSIAYVYYFFANYGNIAEDTYVKFGYKNLEEAIYDADTRTVALLRDLSEKADVVALDSAETLLIKDLTTVIDFAGCNIEINDYTIVIDNANVTLLDLTGSVADLMLHGNNLADVAAISLVNGAILTVDKDVVLDVYGDDFAAVAVGDNAGLTLKGEIYSDAEAILIMGSNTAVTLFDTAYVEVFSADTAIEQSGNGVLMLNGGSVEGAVIVRNGTFMMLDGSIVNDNGTALYVLQQNADATIYIDIRGGYIYGSVCSLLEINTLPQDDRHVTMTLTGGIFAGVVVSNSCTGFINDYDVYFVDSRYDAAFEATYGEVRDSKYMPDLSYFGKTADGVQLARSFEAQLIDTPDGAMYAWYAEDAVVYFTSNDDDLDDNYYSTMYEALNLIYCEGDDVSAYTITLIKDVTNEPVGLMVDNNVTIDLAGLTAEVPAFDGIGFSVGLDGTLTIKNGILTLDDTATYDAILFGALTVIDAIINSDATIINYASVELKGATTVNANIAILPVFIAENGTNAILTVADEAVTVNGDIIVGWQIEDAGLNINTTGKGVVNISEGTFNGTVRLAENAEFSIWGYTDFIDTGFVGNITGGYFAFPEDDTYLPNNMLCAKHFAFAIGEVALAEGITTDSGRTTYYEIVEAVAEAEFYTIVGNDGDATVWVGFATLEEALKALSDTGNVRLFKDITLNESINLDINDQITLDMATFSIDMVEDVTFYLTEGYALTVKNGDIIAYSTAFDVSDLASLTIEDATLDAVDYNAYGSAIKMSAGGKLFVYNATISSEGGSIIGSDYSDDIGNVIVTLGEGAIINAPDETYYYGVQMYCYAIVKIHNATLTGGNGVQMSQGTLTISGNDTLIDAVQYAVNVCAGTDYDWATGISTPQALSVDITGGQFKGEYAFYEESNPDGICNINISNGWDSVPVFTGNFHSVQEGFIRGGAFQYVDDEGTYLPGASFENMAEGYWPIFNANDNYYYVEYKAINAIGYAEAEGYIVYIANINDGFDAVADGKQIEILVDAEDAFILNGANTAKDIIIDLNGNTLTMTATSEVVAPGKLTLVNGTVTPAEGVTTVLTIHANKSEATASVVLGADMVVNGSILNYGVLELTDNAVVEFVTLDIENLQTTNSYLKIHSANAMISNTLTVGRTNPYRNAGVPQIDMTAGNIYKLALLEHNNPEIYVDPTYSYDVAAGKNSITGGYIGLETDAKLVELFVKEGYQFAEFSTKYAIFAEAAEGETVAPEIVYTDLLVGSGLEMHPYILNLETIDGYTAKVNGHDATLVMGDNGMPYVIIPLSALQVAKTFVVAINDAEGNIVMTDEVCFLDAAKELLLAGEEDVVNLVYALINYAKAFTEYFASDDYASIMALEAVLEGTAYADGALNNTIAGAVETINNVSTYTITDANGEGISSTRNGVSYFNYNTYGRVGITPNVIYNDKFDLVLDFRFEKADMDALDVANFVATVTADKDGFAPMTVAVTKAVNAAGKTVLRVILEDVSAMDLEVNYTITVNTVDNTGNLAYTLSVASYMAERMVNDSSESYKDLMKALYLYHKAAEPFDSDIIELND